MGDTGGTRCSVSDDSYGSRLGRGGIGGTVGTRCWSALQELMRLPKWSTEGSEDGDTRHARGISLVTNLAWAQRENSPLDEGDSEVFQLHCTSEVGLT